MTNKRFQQDGLPLPPYGVMTEGLQAMLDGDPEVPAAFIPDAPADERTSQWEAWRNETKALIAQCLWPEWVPSEEQWLGNAREQMYDLTGTDLRLIATFKDEVLRKEQPDSPVGDPARPMHEAFFRSEDDSGLFNQYHYYDFTLGADLIEQFRKAWDAKASDKFGTVHLQFKRVFQRPRPFQTVFLLNRPTFRPLRSISAGTPSLCSGHSLQGVIGMGAVIEFVLLNGIPLSTGSWCALRQHAVDIGDRRVFAGLHYPSDNLASWIIAMRLANVVFLNPRVKVHLWKAISRQSKVFEVLTYESIYEKAVNALRAEAADVEKAVAEMPIR
jgi:hypothetical protein